MKRVYNIILCLAALSLSGLSEAYEATPYYNECYNDCMPCCYEGAWGSIYVGVSAIKPGGLSSLPIAVRIHSATPTTNEGWEGKLYTLSFDWNPAWEVAVTKNLCCGGAVGLQYWGTYFDDSFSVSDPGNLHFIWSAAEATTAQDLDRIKAHSKLHVAKVALNYTDLFTCTRNMRINWYTGLTFYYFDSTVKAEGFINENLVRFTKNDDTNYLIGPTTGIVYNYNCNKCLNLYLNTNLTLSFNSHRIKRMEGSPTVPTSAPMDFHYRFCTVLPILESALGITFTKCNWDLSVEYGFKWFYHLFDSVQQVDDVNESAGVSTPYDISFHGITFRVGRGF